MFSSYYDSLSLSLSLSHVYQLFVLNISLCVSRTMSLTCFSISLGVCVHATLYVYYCYYHVLSCLPMGLTLCIFLLLYMGSSHHVFDFFVCV